MPISINPFQGFPPPSILFSSLFRSIRNVCPPLIIAHLVFLSTVISPHIAAEPDDEYK